MKLGRKKQLPCPILNMLDVADELLHECQHPHFQADQIRGLTMVHRDIALRVHQALPCRPSINADGLLVCSLSKVCASLSELLFVRHDPSYWSVPLATIATGKPEAEMPTGAFL